MGGEPDFLPLFLCFGFVLTAGATVGFLWFCSTYFYQSWTPLFCSWWLLDDAKERDAEAATNVLHTLRPKNCNWVGSSFYDLKD